MHVIGILILLLVACSDEVSDAPLKPEPESPDNSTSESDAGVIFDGYPGPGTGYPQPLLEQQSPIVSAYPGQESGPSASVEAALPTELQSVPTPTSDEVGTVTGILILEGTDLKPVPAAILYLGNIVTLDDGSPAMAALNKQLAPVTQTNMVGQFIFEEVTPGNYTLILDQVTSSFLLNSPSGGDLIIEVFGGEVADLGELRFADLPIVIE